MGLVIGRRNIFTTGKKYVDKAVFVCYTLNMRYNVKLIIGSGLVKAIEAARKKEDRLRAKFMHRENVLRNRIYQLKGKLVDTVYELRYVRNENKHLRRAVHYLEHLNGGITPKQTAKLEKVLGLPKNITRADDWHKAKTDGYKYSENYF